MSNRFVHRMVGIFNVLLAGVVLIQVASADTDEGPTCDQGAHGT